MKSPNQPQLTRRRQISSTQSDKARDPIKRKNEEPNEDSLPFSTPKSESCVYESLRLKTNSYPLKIATAPDQLIPSPRTPRKPNEILRKSLVRVKSSQWTESVHALRDIVQISRFNPQLLHKYLPAVYKEITSLVQHQRTTAVRTACQAANEIFINVTTVEGQELENLVFALLEKTDNSNSLIQEDASEALDSLIIQIPAIISIKILLNKRITGFSEPSRATAAKLLVCVVNALGMESGSALGDDLKTRLVNAAVRFLQDDYFEIKVHGMNLVTMFMQNDDFSNIFQTKFSNPLLKKVKPKSNLRQFSKC